MSVVVERQYQEKTKRSGGTYILINEYSDRLKTDLKGWNQWRSENIFRRVDLTDASLYGIDLSGADLREADLRNANLHKTDLRRANFCGSDLRGANLRNADMTETNFRDADLRGAILRSGNRLKAANLKEADLTGANLYGIDLRGANLNGANLSRANLSRANLRAAHIVGANLRSADLHKADLSNLYLGSTLFFDTNLKGSLSLETCSHQGASSLDYLTIEKFGTMMPTAFLRGCGLPEKLIEYYPSLLNEPISYYSCFISYSHEDKIFARRLHDQLQGRGIRCWLDEHQLLPGDDIYEQVDQGIRIWDKVILCASESALTSWWVENEIKKAFKKEQILMNQRKKKVLSLIPINLDGHLFRWENGLADEVRSRLAPNFIEWETNNTIFEEAFENIVKALQMNNTGREIPPSSKL